MKGGSALGAKTARACDSCLRRRARWFCAADDAFLCHGCDTLVHSANQLASRHERVRLQTSSSSASSSKKVANSSQQVWYSGFTRKARTPRHNSSSKQFLSLAHHQKSKLQEEIFNSTLPVVPELEVEGSVGGLDESDERLLCRVPEFDPSFEDELCNIYSCEVGDERLEEVLNKNNGGDIDEGTCDLDNFSEFLASDMDLAEFAADVESLLESGFDDNDDESAGSELMLDCKQEEMMEAILEGDLGTDKNSGVVKIKDEQIVEGNMVVGMTSSDVTLIHQQDDEEEKKGKIFLRLNYEDVISAWASQGCPWTTGNPPQFNSYDCWPHCLVYAFLMLFPQLSLQFHYDQLLT